MALDEVWDPQNFGALLRTAQYYGIDKIITCSKNSAPLSPAVSKASAGAMEILLSKRSIYSTNNMEKFLQYSKINNWQIVGASSSDVDDDYTPVPISIKELFTRTLVVDTDITDVDTDSAVVIDTTTDINTDINSDCDTNEHEHVSKSKPCGLFNLDKPTILVLGNEGHGLRTNIMRKCDVLLNIPQNPATINNNDSDSDDICLNFDSLNVSVAGGILMHSLVLNRK